MEQSLEGLMEMREDPQYAIFRHRARSPVSFAGFREPRMSGHIDRQNMKAVGVAMIRFSGEEIREFMKSAHHCGVPGGGVCDCLNICAARKSGASRICTLNKRHFTAIAPELTLRIFHPRDV
jgi:hypothetical protein